MVPVPKRGLELVLVLGEYRNIKIEKIKNIPPPPPPLHRKRKLGYIAHGVCIANLAFGGK